MAQNINQVPTSPELTDKDYLIGSVDNKLRRVPKSFFAKLLPDGVNEKFSVLEGRMNAFTTMEAGSTTGDAELQDIRVGADGVTYDTAGESVRIQVTKVSSSLEQIVTGEDVALSELFNKNNLRMGGYYDVSGEWVDEVNYSSTDFIDIHRYIHLSLVVPGVRTHNFPIIYAFYDENKNIVGNGTRIESIANVGYTGIIEVPVGTTYFTISNLGEGGMVQYNLLGYVKNPFTEKQYGLAGKKLSILGDSISTYIGCIPDGNETFYTGTNCQVTSVADTWWQKVLNATQMELCVNESWSGSTVSNTRQETHPNSSGVDRCENLNNGDEEPDVIIIYMGTNDFRNSVPLGAYDGTQEFPTSESTFREAFAIMLKKVLTKYPKATVYICTLKQFEHVGDVGFPDTNNQGLTTNDYTNAILDIATLFGCPVIDINKSGLNYFNLEQYCGDYNSETGLGLHPNADGMTKIANRVLKDIIREIV